MSDIDDTSSVAALSEAVTETASQPSTLNTRSAAAGSTAFATFRGGRSVSDQLRDIDTNEIPTEVSLMSKIKIQREDYVSTDWLHRKKRARKSPIDPYGRRLTKVVGNREKGDFWLCNQCDKKKEISLYALVNSGTSGALRRLRKDHDLLVGEVDSETIESEPPRRRQRQRTERRIRCTNHIYNLGATSYLEGKLKDVLKSLESQPAEQAALRMILDFLEEWRPTGAFVRIHNLQGWVRRSSQRREGFLQYAQGKLSEEEVDEFGEVLWEVSQLMLLQDNDTRWNSFFTAIERAFRLKDPIEIYTTVISRHADKTKRIPDEYLLSQDDWHVLAITLAVLLPFKKLTKYFEGRVPRFAEAAASLFYLVDHLRKQLAEYSDSDRVFPGPEIEGPEREIRVGDAPLRFAAAHGSSPPSSPPFSPPAAQSQRPQRSVGLPHKYRDSVIDLPGRPVGSINPPRCEKWPNPPSKTEIADVNLRAVRDCITCAIYKLEKYVTLLEDSPAYWTAMIIHPAFKDKWIREYLPGEQAKRIVDSFKQFFDRDYNKRPTQPTPIQKKTKSSHLGAHSYLAQRPSPANRDEVKEYLEEPIYEDEEVEDPFEWWRQREKDFPRLARMAYDLLSIPSTACECERVFSLAKLLVGTQRHSLQDLTMEMLTCVKFWRRNPLI
ncbi:HAT, C-terminal dimerization domain [Fusarium oxysporum f. sp. vasinfectum]|nr:HAT, C-terminal dimerization domain [Fusarium oxysporum f. sp. vasinfectum]KAK2680443.1 HAT, C-terminal dimerization domain [Fusarium oxysporum f. sp. vasinfectum]